jgi:putative DNA primase/helicase
MAEPIPGDQDPATPVERDGEPAPQAPDAASAASSSPLDAHGATAPLDNVVSLQGAAVAKRKAFVSVGEFLAAAAENSPAPPTPGKSANAHNSGTGEEPSPAEESAVDGAAAAGQPPKPPPRKPEKTIDWGKFNSLVEHFALIYGTDTVWDGTERMIMKIANMGHAHGSDMVRLWKGSERRRTVRQQDVVFDPTETCDLDVCVNLFGGLAMEPQEGDVSPMLDLVRYLTSRASDDADECDNIMHWLLCWLAYPLQHQGAKMRTSIIMHGDEGAGKNFLFDTVTAIYGKYGALVGQDELEDKFNDWRSCKLFVVGDEVSSRAELVHNKNRLKALITSPVVQINPKNMPRREESNHINIVFLSNELQPLALDNSDRRYLVVYTPRAKGFEYYRALGEWRKNGGTEAFYHYLLHYPLDDFDPYAPAPATEAKAALIGINRKSPEQFWWEWANGELDLPYQSCSMQQAYKAYLKYCVRTGERYPFKREQFTPTVIRFSESQDKPARVKPMKLDSAGAKKVERMFLVCDPEDAIREWQKAAGNGNEVKTQGEWATACVEGFAEHLKVFLGWNPRSPGGSTDGEGDAG